MAVGLEAAVAQFAEALGAAPGAVERELADELVTLAEGLRSAAVPNTERAALERVDTPASPDAVGLVVPWLRGEAAWSRMRATAVPLAVAAARLGVSDSALRRVIGPVTGPGVELLGVKDARGAWRVLAYQLPDEHGVGGEPASAVGRRAQRSLPAGMHPVAVASWWDAPNAALYLDGEERTPRAWVAAGWDPDQVFAAAEHEDAA